MTRRRIGGYTDMGSARIPPLPQFTILTDRDDGTLWGLIHELVGGFYHVGIDDSLPGSRSDYVIFPPYQGPVISTAPRARLFVEAGYLGYEYEDARPGLGDRDQARILTREGRTRRTFEIVAPEGIHLGIDALAYEEVEF